jgi:zinc protease
MMAQVLRGDGAAVRSRSIAFGVVLPALIFLCATFSTSAFAMKIQQVRSPKGIEAWLVEEHSVPLMAMRFSFEGGNAQDPVGKDGVANFLTAMMDEGAGDLTSLQFQERTEEIAMRMGFEDTRDSLYGSFETLTVNREAAVGLLKLAVNKPRFDGEAVDRIRGQLLAGLAFAAKDPDRVVANEWFSSAFPNHPYGRPASGTEDSLSKITRDDLEAYRSRVFARNNLKVVAVGDIDAATLGKMLDEVFGDLPEKAQLVTVPHVAPRKGGEVHVVEMSVPQSVATFGLGGVTRHDPDFMAAYVMNHILGGGGFTSRLMEQVREKRGLAYSVFSYLQPYQHASIFAGGVATKNEEIGQSLDVIRAELKGMAEQGPTQEELDNAKAYLVGSYALRFDTNSKIASQLLGILQDDLGMDYIERRNALIEAVTLDDVKRVAKRILDTDNLIVTVVGKPKNLRSTKG